MSPGIGEMFKGEEGDAVVVAVAAERGSGYCG